MRKETEICEDKEQEEGEAGASMCSASLSENSASPGHCLMGHQPWPAGLEDSC